LRYAELDALFTQGIDFAQAFCKALWEWWEKGGGPGVCGAGFPKILNYTGAI
jgi:hypothetical protein